MSRICGVCHFDLRPPSPELETQVRTALSSPGFFAPQFHGAPGLLAGWAAGSDGSRGPGIFQEERSVCLWDGRIDNAADLARQTGSGPDCPEAALILSLYRQKGLDGLHDVVGDWSVCIWDADRREIVLASDFAGIRPLYYHRAADVLYWSSSLTDLVRWTGITEPDDTYLVSYLANAGAAAATPYAKILAVPAGHGVSISTERVSTRPFWTLPVDRRIKYADEREYEQRMLELFREGVLARMARSAPTCAELSGGLDSSSVVCMANRLLRESPEESGRLIALSYTSENSVDEKYFREVERFCRLSGHHLHMDSGDAAAADQVGAIPSWWEPRFRKLARLMQEMGSAVLLTGQLGDFVMGNFPDDAGQVTECLAEGNLAKALRVAYAWARVKQAPVYPILWRSIREAYFSWTPSTDPREAVGAMPASMEDSFVPAVRARIQAQARERSGGDVAMRAAPGRRHRFRIAAEIFRSRRLQTPEALQHLSYSHPYAHRPLVEFMLTIPSHVVFGPGQPRRLMRRAFAGLLPPMVLSRRSKASYASTFRAPLLPMAKLLLQHPAEIGLVQRGYLEARSLSRRLEKFTQGLDCNETQLRQIVLLEFWLRSRMAASTASSLSQPVV